MLLTVTATLLLLLCPLGNSDVDLSPLAATCNPATLGQVVQSTLYIDLVSTHDPEVVFGWHLPSAVAADRVYDVTLSVLQIYGLSNAASVARRFKNAVSQVDPFTIALYYLNIATIAGEFTSIRGLLNCYNAVDRATQFSKVEQREFQRYHLDPYKLESYVQSALSAIHDRLRSVGYSLEENEQNWQLLGDLFYNSYRNYAS